MRTLQILPTAEQRPVMSSKKGLRPQAVSDYRRAWTPAEEPCGQDVHRATLLRRSWTIAARPWDRMSLRPHSQAGGRRGRRRLRAPDPGTCPPLAEFEAISEVGIFNARACPPLAGRKRLRPKRTSPHTKPCRSENTPQAIAPRQPPKSRLPFSLFVVQASPPAWLLKRKFGLETPAVFSSNGTKAKSLFAAAVNVEMTGEFK